MAILTFNGNQVAEWSSIDDATIGGEDATTFSGIETLPATAVVSFEIDDALINPDGTLNLSGGDITIDIQVDGMTVATGIKLKLETGGDSKEYGDTFLVTDDAVDLNNDGTTDKLVFYLKGTFTDGVDVTIIRDADDDGSTDFDLDCVCFGSGSLIKTITGYEEVEKLRVGHLIWTLDNGYQPILWIGKSRQAFDSSNQLDPPVHVSTSKLFFL